MPTLERTVEIAGSPEAVWNILVDPTFIPKLYPDVIMVTSDPPGMARVGSKRTTVRKIGGRRIEASFEVTEAEPNKKLVLRQRPGGFFKTYFSTQTLEPTKKGTRVTSRVEFEPSVGFLGRVLSVLVVNRAVKKNVLESLDNLKELAELKELPGTSSGQLP